MDQLVDGAPHRLAPKRHGRIAETAERAVAPLAPPAAPGRLEQDGRRVPTIQPARAQLIEEVVVVRDRECVRIPDRRRIPVRTVQGHRVDVPACIQAGQIGDRLGVQHPLHQLAGKMRSPSPRLRHRRRGTGGRPRRPSRLGVGTPKTTKIPGHFSFRRFASASEATCCWNTLVKPTSRGRQLAMCSTDSFQKQVDLSANPEQPIDEGLPRSAGIAACWPTSPQDVVEVRRLIETGGIKERRGKHPVAREVPHG